jgi:hypothetical protein
MQLTLDPAFVILRAIISQYFPRRFCVFTIQQATHEYAGDFREWSVQFCIRVRRRLLNVSMVANTVGIQMPADFPLAAYNDIHAHIAPLQPRFPDAYRHYGGAWNAVEIRFRSTAEADDVFQLSLNDPSSVEQRFRQEVALFQFFTNSVSVLDSCAYALHALGNRD